MHILETTLIAVSIILAFGVGYYLGEKDTIEAVMQAAEIRCLLGI